MVWIEVESTDVAAVGWEPGGIAEEAQKGIMALQFHRPPGSTYLYYDVPLDFYEEFMAAPSKGQFVNRVLKGMHFSYAKVA